MLWDLLRWKLFANSLMVLVYVGSGMGKTVAAQDSGKGDEFSVCQG
jgi:hypothetical protein